MKRRILFAATLLAAAIAGAVATVALRGTPVSTAAQPPPPAATAVVERTTLTSSTLIAGTLGYSNGFSVTAPGGTTDADLAAAEEQAASAELKVASDENALAQARSPSVAAAATASERNSLDTAEATLATAQHQLAGDRRLGCPETAAAAAGSSSASGGTGASSGSGTGAASGSGGGRTSGPTGSDPGPATAPAALTGSASASTTTAELSGTVLPGNLDTSYLFQYGTGAGFGASTPAGQVGAGAGAATVAQLVTGLRPGATYIYRLVATNALGTARGATASFTAATSSCVSDAASVAADQQAVSAAQAALTAASSGGSSSVAAAEAQLAADQLSARYAEAALSAARSDAANSATTLTAIAPADAILRRGASVYALDGAPVPLFYGSVVPSRALYLGVTPGPDVAQLNENLTALGFGRTAASGDLFTTATAASLSSYQRSLGESASGVLRLGDVVVAPGPIRITSDELAPGQSVSPGAAILQATSTTRVVMVPLSPNNSPVVSVGEAVSILLPSNATVPGVVSSIGPPSPGQASSSTTLELTVVPRPESATGSGSGLPVQVSFTTALARNVLAMPIAALIALAGGGYGAEVVERSGAHVLVGVQTGLFSNTEVEVSGAGISAGTRVVVAQ